MNINQIEDSEESDDSYDPKNEEESEEEAYVNDDSRHPIQNQNQKLEKLEIGILFNKISSNK
jgi:hypothetical protein